MTIAVTPCLAAECDRMPVWQATLGVGNSYLLVDATVTMIIYKLSRQEISRLREQEERSHYALAIELYEKLFGMDSMIRVIQLVAILSFFYNAGYCLTQDVAVTARTYQTPELNSSRFHDHLRATHLPTRVRIDQANNGEDIEFDAELSTEESQGDLGDRAADTSSGKSAAESH